MKRSRFPYLVLTPMLLLLTLFVVVPIIGSFVMAFFDYNPLRETGNTFVGFANFRKLFNDDIFKKALTNTLYYVSVMVGLNLVITLIVAQALCSLKSNKWRNLFRVNFFMPCVAPLVAVAMVWQRSIFPLKGGINLFLGHFGVKPIDWLGNASMLMPSLIALSLWADVGYNIVLFIAGIQGIPKDFYESAEIDGANAFARFFRITLPLLSRTLAFVVAMTLISQFQAFAQFITIAGADGGGAGRAGYVLTTYIYDMGFKAKDLGYGSAVAIMLFLLILIVTVAQNRLHRVDWGY